MLSRAICAFTLLPFALAAQAHDIPDTPAIEECLRALARSAALFASTAPGLTAEETLEQRGRHGFIEILKGTKAAPKKVGITVQPDFRLHRVVSSYGLSEMGDSHVLHEIRKIITMDGKPLGDATEVRHALTMGVLAADDHTKRILLENFEQAQLEGAVTDFGQLLLLFRGRNQGDYEFSAGGQQLLAGEQTLILNYRQISGSQGLTVFDGRTEDRQKTEGQIWLQLENLIPLRITMSTERHVSKKDIVRTEARVDYKPGPLGLVPVAVIHRQFLNQDLMVENSLSYADYQRPGQPGMIP